MYKQYNVENEITAKHSPRGTNMTQGNIPEHHQEATQITKCKLCRLKELNVPTPAINARMQQKRTQCPNPGYQCQQATDVQTDNGIERQPPLEPSIYMHICMGVPADTGD